MSIGSRPPGGWFSQLSLGTHVTVVLAGVCRRWRSVALSFATLWSDIGIKCKPGDPALEPYYYPTRFAELCLKRSKAALIQVEIQDEYGKNSKLPWIDLFSSHSSRIKDLRLDVRGTMLKKIQWETPNLVDLSIRRMDRMGSLPLILKGSLPRLRNVTISHFQSWAPGLLVNLTSLELREGGWDDQHGMVSMAYFLDLLEHNPLLETLQIVKHGPTEDGSPGRIVRLSQLSSLTIYKSFSAFILSHLDLPPFTNISIEKTLKCMREFNVLPDEGPLASMNLLQTFPTDYSRIKTLHDVESLCYGFGPGSVNLELTNSQGYTVVTEEPDPCDWDKLQTQSEMYLELFRAIPNLQCIARLEKLSICVNDEIDPYSTAFPAEDWRDLFEQTPTLKYLILRDIGLTPVCLALAPKDGEGPPLCPNLEWLEVENADIEEGDDLTTWPQAYMQKLLEFAQRRHSAGFQLRTIQLPFKDLNGGNSKSDMRYTVEFWRPQFAQFGIESFIATEFS